MKTQETIAVESAEEGANDALRAQGFALPEESVSAGADAKSRAAVRAFRQAVRAYVRSANPYARRVH